MVGPDGILRITLGIIPIGDIIRDTILHIIMDTTIIIIVIILTITGNIVLHIIIPIMDKEDILPQGVVDTVMLTGIILREQEVMKTV